MTRIPDDVAARAVEVLGDQRQSVSMTSSRDEEHSELTLEEAVVMGSISDIWRVWRRTPAPKNHIFNAGVAIMLIVVVATLVW
jgi:hypothetical protein